MDRWCKLLMLAVIALTAPGPTAAALPPDTAAVLDEAAKRFDLKREGSAPFQIRARVVATDVHGESFEGNYHLLWVSPTAWLGEVAFPTFWEAWGRSGKLSWRKRKLEFTPEPVRWVNGTVQFAERLEREPTWTGDPVKRKRARGVEQSCIDVHPNDSSWRRWCFDSISGNLLREDAETGDDLGVVIVYSDWREVGGKRFPGKIVHTVAKRRRVELVVTEFEKVQDVDPARFEPPRGADEDPVCDSLIPPKPPPEVNGEVPRSSDGQTLKGDAILEFRIARDGTVHRMKIVSSTSAQFGHAVAGQISRLKFTPATCDGRPVEMSFSLRRSAR